MALLLGLPFLAVEGNTGKISSLLGDIGVEERSRDLETLACCSDPPLVPAFTPTEKAKISHFLEHARTAADEMFRWIVEDVRTTEFIRH